MINKEQERLKAEAIHEQIMDYVRETDNPRDKAYLLLLHQMQDTQTRLTESIATLANSHSEYTSRFDTHEKKEIAILNRAKGAWWVMAALLTVGQGLLFVTMADNKDRDALIESRLDISEQWISGHTQHHEVEEKHQILYMKGEKDGSN